MGNHQTSDPASAPIGQATAEHVARSLALADRVIAVATDGLSAFELSIMRYPDEFKAIMWDAIVEIAKRRAKDARGED